MVKELNQPRPLMVQCGKEKCNLLLGRCWDQCFFPGLSMVEPRFSPVLSFFIYSALGNVKKIIYDSHGIKVL